MRGIHGAWTAIAGLVLTLSASGLTPGVAQAKTPHAPVTITFYMGATTPVQIDAEPWAAVTIDGRRASLASLGPGLVADIAVDSHGRAVEIDASNRTVSGTVGAVHVSGSGQLYLVIDGKSYQARLASAVVAEGGSVIGGLVANQAMLQGNAVVAHLGPDGRVGYVEIG